MSTLLRVLIVEDSENDATLTVHALRRGGYQVESERVQDAEALGQALDSHVWDIVISDWSMPRFSALGALLVVQERKLDLPFLVVSGTIGEETAIKALQAGAHDFVVKGKLTRLLPAVERELRKGATREAQRRAEHALRESEDRYRVLFAVSPVPMWVYDTTTLAFLTVNEAAVRHYGYTEQEFMAMTIADIRPEQDVQSRREAGDGPSAVDDGSSWRHRRKDGGVLFVEIRAHDFVLQGRPTRLVLVNDVTERRRVEEALRKTEEQLRQAQKMEAVGRLAGGVAHDFNNVLSVILSYCEMMMGDLESDDPMRDDMDEVRMAARRAAELTKQLLTFSRHHSSDPSVLDLNLVLSSLDGMLRRIVGEDVELVTLSSGSGARVVADQGHIEQVVLNLVVNARDAMPKGGKLTIETANVMLDETYVRDHLGAQTGPHVMVAVTDTGEGMDRDTQAHIFEPFFTTKEVGKGTGLGLSIVFGILQQSQGSIWVYSEQGKGTTFKFYLPRTDEALRHSRPPMEPATLGGSETILLVEDEEQLLTVAAVTLRRRGYLVIEARSGDEALVAAENHPGRIHLLLTDLVMPGMSGAELATRLMAARPNLRVMCMSGYTDDTVVRHGIVGSGMAFLQKPITPDSLLRKLREVLDAGPVKKGGGKIPASSRRGRGRSRSK
jgi:two-component system cell cycle sensor histidine kinase/response regulator CckA